MTVPQTTDQPGTGEPDQPAAEKPTDGPGPAGETVDGAPTAGGAPGEVRELTYAEAVRETLTDLMEHDERVFLMGEDIGVYGGGVGGPPGGLPKGGGGGGGG